MTIWQPTLQSNKPRYQALADALAQDLAAGMLKPGDRLPTHRELADFLGVTIGTISRGYAEAERRGLTVGEIGRGTFIRQSPSNDPWPQTADTPTTIDFSLALPVQVPEETTALAETLRLLADDPSLGALLQYRPASADLRQRERAAGWLNRLNLQTRAEDVLVTAGSQHALNVVLAGLLRAGEVLLTEALTYPSIKSQARQYGVKLRGVAMDEQGLLPEALALACAQEPRPRALYTIPTLQNPTTVTMPAERRQAIADLVVKHDLWLIEDDVFSFLTDNAPAPLATLIPERTLYLSSVAKCLVTGLRTGFLVAPAPLRMRLLAAIHNTLWMAAPLMVEVATRWLADGTAERIIAAKRREIEARQSIAREILAPWTFQSDPLGYQIWLHLPEPWTADEFTARARARGVILVGGGAFAVNRRDVPHAVRLSIGLPDRERMREGLTIVADILASTCTATY